MRITGGIYRSRVLRAPKGEKTRPTTDRVREALFSILAAQAPFEGLRVLDLYAGTGALGLEAISRGADHTTFVESHREAIASIRANIATLGCAKQTRVVAAPVERSKSEFEGAEPFDLVFADPPYADVPAGRAADGIASLVSAQVFASGARLVLEHAARDPSPQVGGLVLEGERRYGDSRLSFYVLAP